MNCSAPEASAPEAIEPDANAPDAALTATAAWSDAMTTGEEFADVAEPLVLTLVTLVLT